MQQPAPPAPLAPVQPQPPTLAPGALLVGRYLVQGYIGGGGFAHIYRVEDRVLGHQRALKEAFYRDAQTAQQFRLEAEFLLNARHPNLVRGYAAFEHGGRFYLVMDYVDGQTLEEIAIQHIRRTGRPLAEARVLDWMLPVCDAIETLHAQPMPVIHRDIKPANIKLTRAGVPVLIDLGLAKLYAQGSNTLGAALAFTPGYAPPEQYQASGLTDQRTDVYGLGATLYYLLTGYQPTESPARLSVRALPAPRTLNPALSAASEAAMLRAMELDPARRQQSIAAIRRELAAVRQALAALPAPGAEAVAILGERMTPCARCGTANPPEARFCLRCGGPVVAAGEPGPAPRLVAADAAEPPPVPNGAPFAMPAPRPRRPYAPAGVAAAAVVAAVPARGPLALPAGKGLPLALGVHETEARAAIAAALGVVCFAFSLMALYSGWTILFVAPALALAGWSWLRQVAGMPPELRWLTQVTLFLSGGWLAVWLLAQWAAHLH
ncbi:MAG TPA: serine/threonine-protein kinase [Ktedonobacterales bacterium]|nr:serine/threonine-protein kinase [Ktedonobacterales bacterium]